MALTNDKSLSKSVNTFPPEKISPVENEVHSKVQKIEFQFVGRFDGTADAELLANDEILGPLLPEGCLVHDAKIIIDASTGAGGIFDLGHKAGFEIDDTSLVEDQNVAIAEDQNAFVNQADAGGQAVMKRMDLDTVRAGQGLKVGKGGLQLFIKCTEATTAAVAGAVKIRGYVEYTYES